MKPIEYSLIESNDAKSFCALVNGSIQHEGFEPLGAVGAFQIGPGQYRYTQAMVRYSETFESMSVLARSEKDVREQVDKAAWATVQESLSPKKQCYYEIIIGEFPELTVVGTCTDPYDADDRGTEIFGLITRDAYDDFGDHHWTKPLSAPHNRFQLVSQPKLLVRLPPPRK